MKQEFWIEKMMFLAEGGDDFKYLESRVLDQEAEFQKLLESMPRASRGRLEDYVEDLKRVNDTLVVKAYLKGLREGEEKAARKKG